MIRDRHRCFHRTVTNIGKGPVVYEAKVTALEDYVVTVSPAEHINFYERVEYLFSLRL